MDIKTLPEFGPAFSAYQAALAVAERDNDQLRVAQVKQEWAEKQLELHGIGAQREQEAAAATQRFAQVREEVKKNFPTVPEALYAHITDPDQLVTVVADLSSKMTAQQWGGAPATPSGAPPDTSAHVLDDPEKRNALWDRVEGGDVAAVKQFTDGYMEKRVFPLLPGDLPNAVGVQPAR